MDESNIKKKRQNLIGISLIIIFFHLYGEAENFDKIQIFGMPFKMPINHIKVGVLFLYGYFLYRYSIEWIEKEKQVLIQAWKENVIHKLWIIFKYILNEEYEEQISSAELRDIYNFENSLKAHVKSKDLRFKQSFSFFLKNHIVYQGQTIIKLSYKFTWKDRRIIRYYLKLAWRFIRLERYTSDYLIPLVAALIALGILLVEITMYFA